ncbi:MAG TPA: hypothetical protein PKZ53_05500 [Acidobacteriota bacterium]|nr:hypothetical protein [Acidobacteriota bacterium]
MLVTRRGMRLSVQPVTKEEWQVIESLEHEMKETGLGAEENGLKKTG